MRLQHFMTLLFAASGYAHCDLFSHFIVNNTITPEFKYVRDVATPRADDDQTLKQDPQYDIYGTNITCGRLAFNATPITKTADVVAGSEVGFRLSQNYRKDADIFHPGPAQAYIARAPNDDLSTFSGIGNEGDWVKIAFIGASSDTKWITYYANSVNFSIPAKTPPGKYLLRIEHIWPAPHYNTTQWYVSCAHVNIMGNGGGSFEGYKFAKFPGTYDINDPGLFVPVNIGDMTKLLSYQPPGPPVWTGE